MQRKSDKLLFEWARSNQPRPLLIRGARRVGKTYALKHVGEQVFGQENFAYCDFQRNLQQLEGVFANTSDIERIVDDLSLILRKPIVKEKTLIALDEIQLCENALNSLRFFANSGYRVIATGSQLGITLRNRSLPFPSDVDQIVLRPMDFEEFLWACNEEKMAQAIRRSFMEKREFLLHDEALQRYFEYIVVGGMPLVAASYAENRNHEQVRSLLSEIDNTYIADIAIYAPADSIVHIRSVWSSISKQLTRETSRKFKYSDVEKHGRERKYRVPLSWLEAAEMVLVNYQTNETIAPLIARDDGSFFKVYLLDTGLMFHKLNLQAEIYLDKMQRATLSARFRGALAENFVMQSLIANDLEPYYWTPGASEQGEVEFVLQTRQGKIVPIEVKSGGNVRSTSLRKYLEKSQAPYAIRLSTKNFGFENGVYSVPIYATFCIDDGSLCI